MHTGAIEHREAPGEQAGNKLLLPCWPRRVQGWKAKGKAGLRGGGTCSYAGRGVCRCSLCLPLKRSGVIAKLLRGTAAPGTLVGFAAKLVSLQSGSRGGR